MEQIRSGLCLFWRFGFRMESFKKMLISVYSATLSMADEQQQRSEEQVTAPLVVSRIVSTQHQPTGHWR
jgi:hypothetical protein